MNDTKFFKQNKTFFFDPILNQTKKWYAFVRLCNSFIYLQTEKKTFFYIEKKKLFFNIWKKNYVLN